MELLNNNSPYLEQDSQILIPLKPHQKTTLYASVKLENESFNDTKEHKRISTRIGIIADDVGSGKSLCVLSLIAQKPFLKDTEFCERSINSMINIYSINQGVKLNTNVIVVPNSIIKQWERYIKTDTSLSYYVVDNKKALDKVSKDYYILDGVSITLVSSTKYKEFYNVLSSQTPSIYISRLIIDEADSINIPACPKLEAIFYWFVTSSYERLQNPVGIILWKNFDTGETYEQYGEWGWSGNQGYYQKIRVAGIRNNGFIKDTFSNISSYNYQLSTQTKNRLYIRNEISFIKESFELTQPIINIIKCKNPLVYNILQGIVNKDIIDRINAGDIDGAIESISCVKVKENNLIKLVTDELSRKLHNLQIRYQAKSQMQYPNPKTKQDTLNKIQNSIDSHKSQIKAITDRVEQKSPCSICYEDIVNKAMSKCCNQLFCFECISSWLAHQTNNPVSCPFCRKPMAKEEDLIVITDKVNPTPPKDEILTKSKNMHKLLHTLSKKNSKILIFSEFDGSFTNIKQTLNELGMKYSRVIGTYSSIAKIVTNFKQPFENPESIEVLLLNSQYFGSGMNLQNATDIIIYHSMSKELTNQVIGRAQRPGRSQVLNIWKLCHDNELK